MGIAWCSPCCPCVVEQVEEEAVEEEPQYVALESEGVSLPRPCRTGTEVEEKGSKSLRVARPPSVEDEKQFMRRSLRWILEQQESAPKECLLCLEGFTESEPEVLTLCRCGENRNSFHLSCLLRWRRRSGKTSCPVCDQELFFEDGSPPSTVDGDSGSLSSSMQSPSSS